MKKNSIGSEWDEIQNSVHFLVFDLKTICSNQRFNAGSRINWKKKIYTNRY